MPSCHSTGLLVTTFCSLSNYCMVLIYESSFFLFISYLFHHTACSRHEQRQSCADDVNVLPTSLTDGQQIFINTRTNFQAFLCTCKYRAKISFFAPFHASYFLFISRLDVTFYIAIFSSSQQSFYSIREFMLVL